MNGDFNLDLINYANDNNVLNFLNNMYSVGLTPLISKPTRIVGNSMSLLDNIFIAKPWDYLSGIMLTDITDHFPVFLILKNF